MFDENTGPSGQPNGFGLVIYGESVIGQVCCLVGGKWPREIGVSRGCAFNVRLFGIRVKLAVRQVHEGTPMDAHHKYRIGQSVTYRPRSKGTDAPSGFYVILARLPQGDDGQFAYRIRHSHESYERTAKEGELKFN